MVFNWKLRPKGDKLNPYVKYKNDPNLFSLKVNHGGGFSYVYDPKRTRAPRRVYKGGYADWFDDVDADGFSVIEVSCMLKELGYDNPNIKILYKKPTPDLDKGIEPLSKDIDVLELLSYVHKFKLIELFIEHPVDKRVLDKSIIDLDQEDNNVIDGLESSNAGLGSYESDALENDNTGLGTQESEGIDNDNVEELDPQFSYPNTNHQKGHSNEHISSPHRNVEGSDDNEESDDTKESEDSDFECDIEDKIDDVHVDMEMFKKNTDPSVEWVGSTEPQPQVDNNDQFVYEECDLEDFDSDIDPDDDEAERKKALRKISKCHKPVNGHLYTENFYVSQTFPNKVMIKDMVTRILVEKRRELYLTKNDKERVRAKCRGLVPVFYNTGPCGESVSNVEGPTDGPKLKERNPHTTVKIDVERNYEPDSPTRKFKRIYGCLGALKSGFKAGQRDLLGLDGCFMSRPFPMQILTVVGVDPNNGIYPLAYAVVESKTKQSWLWFLDCLGDDLELIIPALTETFPAAKHRYCLKHIYDNKKLQWRGKLFKELLWRCDTATTVSHFNRVMEEVKQANKDVYDWLKDISPQHWARSYFSARPHCDVLLNNMCEVLNIQLLDGIDKPIILCLEFIREYLMKRIVIVQQGDFVSRNWSIWGPVCSEYRRKELFKINPCNGPSLWPTSDSPIILTPPDYHTPIGRPPKKRKKSVAELYDGMVKDGKSCKGQRGPQSTGRPIPNQGASQSTQIPSQGIVNHSTPTINVNRSAQQNMSHSVPHVTVNPSA
ncbi:transposase, MuDR [Tanacetum coccineum]